MQDSIITSYTLTQLRAELIDPLKEDIQVLLKSKEEPENLLTRSEAAKFLNVSLVTLNEWTKRGFITKGKIGNRTYYKKSELINAINQSHEKLQGS